MSTSMKAILVIDMPKDCFCCPFMDDICFPKRRFEKGFPFGERAKECPLKPMPNKLDANDWNRMFGGTYKEREAKGYGWNACLEEIEK